MGNQHTDDLDEFHAIVQRLLKEKAPLETALKTETEKAERYRGILERAKKGSQRHGEPRLRPRVANRGAMRRLQRLHPKQPLHLHLPSP